MKIAVMPFGWGEAEPKDVKVLLENAASHLDRFQRRPLAGTIVIVPAPSSDLRPRTHYRPSACGSYFVQLTSCDRDWARLSYQFSHEFCHVLSGYESLRGGPNNWFHEAICELASIFTLRRMAEVWPSCPPYSNWKGYAEALADYTQKLLSCKGRQLPVGVTLREWLSHKEEELRRDPHKRDENAVVAYSLLPILEREPWGWNSIRQLPDSSAMFGDYLLEWYTRVELADRPFVKRILDAFA